MNPRSFWTLLAAGSAALVAASLILPPWLDLEPCHLCIFQRLLFMLLAVLAAVAALTAARGWLGWLAALSVPPLAAIGLGAAAWQSWLQLRPADPFSCMGAQPGLIERLVEWLGERLPALFLATGFCEDKALTILGLSLANWSLAAFALALAGAGWALWTRRPGALRA